MALFQLTVRLLLSGGLVVAASEMAKKNDVFGALIASIPLVSVLAMVWLYNDTGDTEQIASFSRNIFWLVIPSLVLFLTLPMFLHRGIDFWPALSASVALTILAYGLGLNISNGFTA